MRVLVTGADGFVGSHLVPRLAALGHEVRAGDAELDVTEPALLDEALRQARPDAVVHLAALSSVAGSFQEAAAVYRVNYLGTRTLLEALRDRAPGARLLLAGSAEVYGPAAPGDPPFTESAPLRPVSPYARAKAAADLLGGDHAARGLCVVRLRPFPHTGPGQSDRFAASSFARQVAEIEAGLQQGPLHVGNLASVRDYLDVEDVVDAYVRLLDPAVPPDVYNVASGRGVTLSEVLEGILARARVRPAVDVDPARVRPADASVGDARRLGRATGWSPRVSLAETLTRLLDDWRQRLDAG